jgi:hypothetical protein
MNGRTEISMPAVAIAASATLLVAALGYLRTSRRTILSAIEYPEQLHRLPEN